MGCSCLKNDFNVRVEHSDCKTFILSDQSIWMRGDFFDEAESLPISIMPLSSNRKVDLVMYINRRNVYTSQDILGSPDMCLPDDVYCISTTSCGKDYSVHRAYLCSTMCRIDKLTADASSPSDWEYVRGISDLAEGVRVNAEMGKVHKAGELLRILNKKLENVRCGCHM